MNNPGGHFLQTQFWDASPALGGNETWTIHGLWPDLCTGGFEQFCNNTRNRSPEQITHILSTASSSSHGEPTHPDLLEYITKHWLSLDSRNSNLWSHEWNKHGTCISTIEPKCYERDHSQSLADERDELQNMITHDEQDQSTVSDLDVLDYFTSTVLLYTSLPTFEFFAIHGIVPSHEKTYDLEHLNQAIKDSSHGAEATIKCRNHNELSEIWYHFNVKAELRNAMDRWHHDLADTWKPTGPLGQTSNCPKTGIRYLPKNIEPSPTHTHVVPTATATATSIPGRPFIGRGRLLVKVVDGEEQDDRAGIFDALPEGYSGCLIRKGNWFAARSLSSCAIFTADDDVKADEDTDYHLFTLASRFAPCSFVRGGASETEQMKMGNDDGMYFACSQNLPFQTILSNNATVDKQHTDAARKLTLGEDHQYTFYAENEPHKNDQVKIWADDNDGERRLKVEIHWQGAGP